MPPLRTFLPVAPVKTERTHEENQERAYIAASRRSDRSLEARVESARRASEIHKRRTGRSLRVTEQDVLNEEMYEEEDDDLPSQYRRLTAHLQTGSTEFNRRLAAYLTNHVAMRTALDQAITASYAQQFPGAPQFAHNQQVNFPSPFPEQNAGQSSASAPSAPLSAAPLSPLSPHPYRHAPYPMPGMAGYRKNSDNHAASISSEKELQDSSSAKIEDAPTEKGSQPRRSSMPAAKPAKSGLKQKAAKQPAIEDRSADSSNENVKTEEQYPMMPSGFSPFTTSLPPDTQQLVGPVLDPTDPFTSSLMSGSEFLRMPQYETNFYNYVPKDLDPNGFGGMNSTLAPLPISSQEVPTSAKEQSSNLAQHPGSSDFQLQFDELKGDQLFPLRSEDGSNNVTPGVEGAWDAFIDDSSWAENAFLG